MFANERFITLQAIPDRKQYAPGCACTVRQVQVSWGAVLDSFGFLVAGCKIG